MRERKPIKRGTEIATAIFLDALAIGGGLTALAEQTSSNPLSQVVLRVAENTMPFQVQTEADRSVVAIGLGVGSAVIGAVSTIFWGRARRA